MSRKGGNGGLKVFDYRYHCDWHANDYRMPANSACLKAHKQCGPAPTLAACTVAYKGNGAATSSNCTIAAVRETVVSNFKEIP
jgi:hypothetical protein